MSEVGVSSDRLKLKRTPLRIAFTKAANNLREELQNETATVIIIKQLLARLKDVAQRLADTQDEVEQSFLDENVTEATYSNDVAKSEEYREQFTELQIAAEEFITLKAPKIAVSPPPSESGSTSTNQKKFKLPKIELKKFGGEIKDWLNWWSQFQKIHEDEEIVEVDKFQYLIQSMIPESKAMSIIESFPPIASNYKKAIKRLTDRFAREELLVQVYVRELLSMVVERASSSKKTNLGSLYDRLDTQLNHLASLGRTQDKFADFLTPLVESCLPDDVLQKWQWKRREEPDPGDSAMVLKSLMSFLLQVVENEEEMLIARSGFGAKPTENKSSMKKSQKAASNLKNTPTVATLMSTDKEPTKAKSDQCVFCDKAHPSAQCFFVRKKSLDAKKEALRGKNACYACLRVGHSDKKCRAAVRCVACDGKHFTLMCPQLETKSKEVADPPKKEEKDSSSPGTVSATSLFVENSHSTILLKTLPVIISNGQKTITVRAILDDGSQRSYISKNVAKLLNLVKTKDETIIHNFVGGLESAPMKQSVYTFRVSKPDKTFCLHMTALEQTKICGSIPGLAECKLGMAISKELGINTTTAVSADIELLIGADHLSYLITGHSKSLKDGLVAIEYKLGWTVMGVIESHNIKRNSVFTTLHTLSQSIANLWQLDVLGIEEPSSTKSQKENNEYTMNKFQDSVKLSPDGRYQVSLPWKEGQMPLPENKELARRRWEGVKRSLELKGIMHDYAAVFQTWVDEDIIEKVPLQNMKDIGHYLPHRPVIKETSSTTKIRPVFDASAHRKGEPSLNDCLEKGPNLIALIPDLLDRFRLHSVGVISDVEKAFLQIKIAPDHRDYLRFYSPFKDEIFRHKRVVFGVTSSPFLLAAVLNFHLDNVNEPELTEVATKLKDSFYVDNCVTSLKDEGALVKFIHDSEVVMQKAKMNLRGWESNITTFKTTADDREVEVLGFRWNLLHDTLACSLSHLQESPPIVTKRVILSVTQRLFDPIGFTSPVSLQPKLLLQKLWDKKFGWDEPLDEEWVKPFQDWQKHLNCLESVRIPRAMGDVSNATLHVFVDASAEAFAACVFLRIENEKSDVSLVLLRAKARVAPKKILTIPRLELTSCCVGVRLAGSIKKNLSLESSPTVFWSDSTTALWWITHDGSWNIFVNNRVKEIRQCTEPNQWRHIPGTLNPADLPSRGCNAKQLMKSRWWEGPQWLKNHPSSWPTNFELPCPDENVTAEEKVHVLLAQIQTTGISKTFQRISKYPMIIKVCAWIQRFYWNARHKEEKCSGPLSANELEKAENHIIRLIQDTIPEKELLGKASAIIKYENGILHMKSAVAARQDSNTFCFPILLPGDHPIVERLIEEKHSQSCHPGPQILMGVLREQYWILGGRRAVRKAVNQCGKCKRYRAKPLLADPTILPSERVNDAAVFEVTGIDLIGPVYLKDGKKGWIVLFTCAVYRAIHLELVTSLSTDAFLQALRRFISRRGRPSTIISDQGSNFIGSNNAFKALDWEKIKKDSHLQRIEWQFIPPTAAWWGGWWERLVGIVKDLIKRTLGRASLNNEELQTVLCDCESTVNSRPLTYISDDCDSLIPLSPRLFLNDLKSSEVTDLEQVDAKSLNRRFRYKQRLTNEIKQRFRTEYLGQLCGSWIKSRRTRPVKLGEVVIISDGTKKRVNWSLGKVIKTFPGKDGQIRKVHVKTQDSILERPIQRIFPLEVEADELPISLDKISDGGQVPVKGTRDGAKVSMTRSGRMVRAPKVLDLFNCPLVYFC